MTVEQLLKEVIINDDDNYNDSDEDKEEEDLDIVDESFQCPTGSEAISALGTLSIFGMFNDASI